MSVAGISGQTYFRHDIESSTWRGQIDFHVWRLERRPNFFEIMLGFILHPNLPRYEFVFVEVEIK